jgi:uncharacterized Zn-finger protein
VKLKLHMVRHSECRDFSCSECGKEFKRKDKLRDHLKKVHSGAARPEVAPPPPVQPLSHQTSASPHPKFVPKVKNYIY